MVNLAKALSIHTCTKLSVSCGHVLYARDNGQPVGSSHKIFYHIFQTSKTFKVLNLLHELKSFFLISLSCFSNNLFSKNS